MPLPECDPFKLVKLDGGSSYGVGGLCRDGDCQNEAVDRGYGFGRATGVLRGRRIENGVFVTTPGHRAEVHPVAGHCSGRSVKLCYGHNARFLSSFPYAGPKADSPFLSSSLVVCHRLRSGPRVGFLLPYKGAEFLMKSS